MNKERKPFINKFNLFQQLLRDFQSYKLNKKEKDNLLQIPSSIKLVLGEVLKSPIFTEFLINNEQIKFEQRKQAEKEAEMKKKLKLLSPQEEEDEDFTSNAKLIKYKRAKNTSCFGQRSVGIYKHFFQSLNEMVLIKNEVCDAIFTIDKDSAIMCLEMRTNDIIPSTRFVLSKEPSANGTYREDSKVQTKNYTLLNNTFHMKKFLLQDEYNKLIGNKNPAPSNKMIKRNTQYDYLMDVLKEKNQLINFKDENNKTTTQMNTYYQTKNSSNLNTQSLKGYSNLSQGTDPRYTDLKMTHTHFKSNRLTRTTQLPSITQMNKFIKYQIEGKNKRIKKNAAPLEKKGKEYLGEYNYSELIMSNIKKRNRRRIQPILSQ